MVDGNFYANLKDHNQKLVTRNFALDCYTGNVVNTTMEAWFEENCR